MAVDRLKVCAAILASGNGSNAENILRHARAYPSKISIPLLITNNPEAYVITRARNLGVPCEVIPRGSSKHMQEGRILKALVENGITHIFLAGYMQILGTQFIDAYPDRIINIHPSLLPAFPGRDAYGDAFNANVPESGVTLHYVDEGVDTGPIIAQKKFARLPDDTLETFRARGLQLEHEIYREYIDTLVRSEAA